MSWLVDTNVFSEPVKPKPDAKVVAWLRIHAIQRLSRHLAGVLEKLTFPEDVIVTVDVDAYQLL